MIAIRSADLLYTLYKNRRLLLNLRIEYNNTERRKAISDDNNNRCEFSLSDNVDRNFRFRFLPLAAI